MSLATGNPWLGIVGAAAVGVCLGSLHGVLCSLARVNDTAMGIALNARRPPASRSGSASR